MKGSTILKLSIVLFLSSAIASLLFKNLIFSSLGIFFFLLIIFQSGLNQNKIIGTEEKVSSTTKLRIKDTIITIITLIFIFELFTNFVYRALGKFIEPRLQIIASLFIFIITILATKELAKWARSKSFFVKIFNYQKNDS